MTIVRSPLTTEKAVSLIEKENTVTFVVDESAAKPDVKRDVERLYGQPVRSVRTLVAPDGVKLARVRFQKDGGAVDVANKLKIL